MSPRIFIDGQHGTIGLQIRQLLSDRVDLDFIELPDQHRKDPAARRDSLNAADVAILCLPDDAARQAVGWVQKPESEDYRRKQRPSRRLRLDLWTS